MVNHSPPQHVALIMDGNGRWAKKRFMPRIMGHRQGKINLKKLVQHSAERGVKILTVYAFSSENWRRPTDEVGFLMKLFVDSIRDEIKEMHHSGVSIRFLGDLEPFALELKEMMRESEALTANNQKIIFNVAVNYGARAEILRAAKKLCQEVIAGTMSLEAITEADFGRMLYTQDLPDPDLLIRTSGECRISNFLLWQNAYTELYFTDTLFPDFNPKEYDKALDWYQNRERRYGMISEQIDEKTSRKN